MTWQTLLKASRFALDFLVLLPAGALAAMIWVNLAPESYYRFAYAAGFAVNDIGMTLFFALMTKEVVEATVSGGVLHSWRRMWVPVVTAAGATVGPIVAYFWLVEAFDEPMLARAWPVLCAVDLAVAYFVTRALFGRHPAVPFVLLLGIATNVVGFTALALLYPARERHLLLAIVLFAGALGIAYQLRRSGVRSFWPYLVWGGSFSWAAHYFAGAHPALALVPIVPFMRHASHDPGFLVDARPAAHDTLSTFERGFGPAVQLVVFLFALVNAGVALQGLEAGTWALPIAMLVGRPAGTLAGAGLARAAGLHLPHRIGWRELVVVGWITALGFTMSLFFSGVALAPGQLLRETRTGALIALTAGLCAMAAARALHVGRFASRAGEHRPPRGHAHALSERAQ